MIPIIDIEQTGRRIKLLCEANHYSVRKLQEDLCINCPQSIYNWYRGKTLPDLDHLFMLSRLLHVPMHWLLVAEDWELMVKKKVFFRRVPGLYRMSSYYSYDSIKNARDFNREMN